MLLKEILGNCWDMRQQQNWDFCMLKEHSNKNMFKCKQEIELTLGYLRSLKGQFVLGKEELLIEVCKIPYRTTPCCLSQADA